MIMHTQDNQPGRHQVFALPPATLATFQTLTTIADYYALDSTPADEMREQTVIYFDTDDYQLLRTGLAVYVEQNQEQVRLTVENLAATLLGAVDKQIRRRQTVTETIPNPGVTTTPKAWPKALRKAVASSLSNHAKLHPILVSRQQRLVRTLRSPSANGKATSPSDALATVNLDTLTVWSPTDGTTHVDTPATASPMTALGQLTVTFAPNGVSSDDVSEETDETVRDGQESITTWLAAQPGLQSVANGHQALLEQGLLAISSYAPGATGASEIQPHMLIADGCRLIWRKQFMTMLLQEAGVRYSQEREYIHEMRIAIRRMRAAAKLYGHFWPRKTIRPYLAALRKTGRLLGHIRNLDVTLAKARRTQNQDGEKVHAPKNLLKAWRQQRQAAQQKLIHWFDSNEYSDFVAEFQHFCTAPEVHSKHHAAPPVPQQVRHVIPPQILQGFAAVRCYEALFESATTVDYETLHSLRIACKYLRYNLEFVRHLLGAESETLITRLKGLQDLLGDLNDAAIAQILVDKAKHEQNTGTYQEAQLQRMAELSQQVPTALAALVAPESRALLAQALARL